MVKAPIVRWTFLLVALSAAVLLVFGPAQHVDGEMAVVAPAVRQVVPSKSAVRDVPAVSTKSSDEERSDPFAPRHWRATEPAVPIPASVIPLPAQVTAAPSIAPQPPALPYKFVGQMDDGGRLVLYLGRGEQVFLGRLGETIEGEYKIVAITPNQITFEYLPAGTTQILSIPASQ